MSDVAGGRRLFVRQSSGLVREVSVTNALFFNAAAFMGTGVGWYPAFYSLAFEAWMRLAAERLEGTGVPVYLIPGNDDPYEIDEALAHSPYCVNVDGKVVDIPGDLQVIGSGKSNPTPWRTPREIPDDDFREELTRLADEVRDPRRTILLTHCPPHDTGLDTAPLLDDEMRPIVSAGDLLRGPVGSTGVRRAIEELRPLLGVHGHIHESGGEVGLGSTLCINPGSEAAFGILRGYLVDVGPDGVERAFRVEG